MTSSIKTKRAILRPFEESDAEAAFAWFSDPEVMRFIPGGEDRSIEDTQRRIARYRAHEAEHGFSKWIIHHRETGEALGDAGLYHLPDGKRIELGYRLACAHWGKGFAFEVASGWIDWFDAHLPGRPLFADVHPDHLRSQRLLERLGFRRTVEAIEVNGITMLIYRHTTR